MELGQRPKIQRFILCPAILAVGFFVLSLVGLLVRAPWSDAWALLRAPGTVTALRLSLICSLSATLVAIIFGIPLAWILARSSFPGRSLVRGFVILPLVLPPVVGGTALLLALGEEGLVGGWLESAFGFSFTGTTAGVVVAEAFVAMPFLVLAVEGAFRSADRSEEEAAATLGATPLLVFRKVVIPAAMPALVAGAILAWARALGEFGATITFAGNFGGVTRTMPLAVFEHLQDEDLEGAIFLSLILVSISLAVLVGLRSRWWPSR